MTLSMKFEGVRSSPLKRFNWGLAAKRWMDEAGPLVQDALRAKAPVAKTGGGKLRKSIRYTGKVTAANAVLTYSAVDYARYVIDGTVAHTILPRNKQALFWPGAEHPVKAVHHPGTRPDDFVQRALAPLSSEIQAALEAAIAEQLKS